MDKETREFLTKKFEAIDANFDQIRQESGENFEAVNAKFDKIDGSFEAINTKFDKIDGNLEAVDGKFDGIQQHIDAKAVENRRHFEVVAEGLRSDIQQIAEGHQVLLDRQNRLETRILERVDQVEREIGAMIKFSYADLDHRMRALEETVSTLQSRVEHIESRLN